MTLTLVLSILAWWFVFMLLGGTWLGMALGLVAWAAILAVGATMTWTRKDSLDHTIGKDSDGRR